MKYPEVSPRITGTFFRKAFFIIQFFYARKFMYFWVEIREFFTIFNNVLRFSFFIQEFSWKVLNNLNLILYFIYVSSRKFTKVHEQKNTILDFFTWNFWRIVHEFTWIILSWIFGYKARIFFVSNLFFCTRTDVSFCLHSR